MLSLLHEEVRGTILAVPGAASYYASKEDQHTSGHDAARHPDS